MDTNLLKRVKKILKNFKNYWKDDELQRTLVIEDLRKYNILLISALLKDKKIRDIYTFEVNNVTIFKQEEFIDMLRFKEYWANSYTRYSNEIGLSTEGKYLKYNSDIVLDFPYKDCVLEGSMVKEDVDRDEIYYNEVIAKDEIDTLLEPKVFTNTRKYDKYGEHEVTEIKDEDNLIIKGNNLLALYSIKKKYAGKIKLIYIDPPYNTGNDSFKYNDKFNHSSWLTFIKNRLEVAKELLSDYGSIAVYIDNNEIGYLQVLMDEILGRENRGGIVSVKRGSVTGHKTINPGVVNITEYILIYAKNKSLWNPNKVYKGRDRNERYNNFIKNRNMDTDKWEFCSLLEAFAEYKNMEKNIIKKQLGANFEKEIMEFVKANADSVIQFAYPDIDKVSKEAKEIINLSKVDKENIYILKREKEKDIVLKGGQRLLFYSDRLVNVDGELVTGELLSDFWDDVLPNDLHNEGNIKFKKGKKSEKAIKRIMEITTNENDLVLDFFLGSGTTTAVAHKTNRKYIGIEQLNYGENDSVRRMENIINGDKSGISKAVKWQGGGSFIYTELKQLNQIFIDKILNTESSAQLIRILDEVIKDAYLDFKVNIENLITKPVEIEDYDIKMSFYDLSLEKQKEMLIAILDKNQLYVNYSDIDDEDYNVSNKDKRFNHSFYENKVVKKKCLKDYMKD